MDLVHNKQFTDEEIAQQPARKPQRDHPFFKVRTTGVTMFIYVLACETACLMFRRPIQATMFPFGWPAVRSREVRAKPVAASSISKYILVPCRREADDGVGKLSDGKLLGDRGSSAGLLCRTSSTLVLRMEEGC